jgi:DNA repair exonuclease SbcCD ATPase subunit
VKQFLVPSLNRVASILLSQMTGGTRTTVMIDEEFEIMIDGQPLNTLSGSGKAVANLAIRIALGQVLTSKVFPIFMADEIDAAMDQERSNFTTDCLRGLSSVISQVILVTHKRPDADNYVEM